MAQTYYKVTVGGKSINDEVRRKYSLNKWVVAKPISPPPMSVFSLTKDSPQSKLFIFKKYEDALWFAEKDMYEPVAIWKCVVKNPKRMKYRARIGLELIREFWRTYNSKKAVGYRHFAIPAPKGTYCCDAVKLIKLVERIRND